MKKYLISVSFLSVLFFASLASAQSGYYQNLSGTPFSADQSSQKPLGLYDCNTMFAPSSQVVNVNMSPHYMSRCGAMMYNPMTGWNYSQGLRGIFHGFSTSLYDGISGFGTKTTTRGFLSGSGRSSSSNRGRVPPYTPEPPKRIEAQAEVKTEAEVETPAKVEDKTKCTPNQIKEIRARAEANATISGKNKSTAIAEANIKIKTGDCTPADALKPKQAQAPEPEPEPEPEQESPVAASATAKASASSTSSSIKCTSEEKDVVIQAIASALAEHGGIKKSKHLSVEAQALASARGTINNSNASEPAIKYSAKAMSKAYSKINGEVSSISSAKASINNVRSPKRISDCTSSFTPNASSTASATANAVAEATDCPECNGADGIPPRPAATVDGDKINDGSKDNFCEDSFKPVNYTGNLSGDAKECIKASLDNYATLDTDFAICGEDKKSIKDPKFNCYKNENTKENYTNTILNSYSEVMACTGLNEKEFIPVVNQESRFQVNVLNEPKTGYPSAGIAQLAANYKEGSIADINIKQDHPSNYRNFNKTLKKMKTNNKSCGKFNKFLKTAKTVGICELIDPSQDNPDKSLFLGTLAHQLMKDYMSNYLSGTSLKANKHDGQGDIKVCKLKKLNLSSQQRENLSLKMAAYAYNFGPNRAALDLCKYLANTGALKDGKFNPNKFNLDDFKLNGDNNGAGKFWQTNTATKKGATNPNTNPKKDHTHMTQLQENLKHIEDKSKKTCHSYR